MSTNIDLDRHLFYWEGGSVSSMYPPTPAFIAKDHPGEFALWFQKIFETYLSLFLVVKRVFYDRIASHFPVPPLTGVNRFDAVYASYL